MPKPKGKTEAHAVSCRKGWDR